MSVGYGTPEIFPASLGGTAGSVTVTPPAGLASGDGWILLCFGDTDPGTFTITASGFDPISAILKNDNAVGYPSYVGLAKVAGGSEGSVSVAFSSNCYDVQVVSIRTTGSHASSLIGNVTSVTNDSQSTATPSYTVPSVTVQADGSLVINVVAYHSTGGRVNTINTAPSGVTQIGARVGPTPPIYPQWLIGVQAANAGAYAPGGAWTLTNVDANTDVNAVKQSIEIRPLVTVSTVAPGVKTFSHRTRPYRTIDGRWRMARLLPEVQAAPPWTFDQAVVPNAVSLVNLAGSYTDIDESPSAPDGAWLTVN